jgi:hypothetical protein
MNEFNDLIAELLTAEPFRDSRAKNAVAVSVTFAVSNSKIALLKINGRDVRRDAKGKATVKLTPGSHLMEWRGYGAPSTKYEISIDAPATIAWKPKPSMRSDRVGYIFGQQPFTI